MKKLIMVAAILCSLISQTALAIAVDRVDGSGLSAEQAAKAQIFIEAMKKEAPSTAEGLSASARKEVSAWTDLGTNIGKSMVAAARELGTAASEFAQTDLGKIITVIIVFKIIGGSVVSTLLAIVVLIGGLTITARLWKNFSRGDAVFERVPRISGWPTFGTRMVATKFSSKEVSLEDVIVVAAWFVVTIFLAAVLVR